MCARVVQGATPWRYPASLLRLVEPGAPGVFGFAVFFAGFCAAVLPGVAFAGDLFLLPLWVPGLAPTGNG